MPCENEIKLILHSPVILEAKLQSLHYEWCDIEQGYLYDDLRIRRSTGIRQARQHILTFKRRLPNGRNLEIETEIEESDFDGLWPMTKNRLIKRRFTVTVFSGHVHDGEAQHIQWDIDFPRWPSGVQHFAIAEAEMPDWMESPDEILHIIIPHVIYTVPRSDNRFAARRLSDEDYSIDMASRLGIQPG